MAGYGEIALARGLGFLAENQAAISNNLANAGTAGFKRRTSLALEVHNDLQSSIGLDFGSVLYGEQLDFSRGIERPTGDDLNVSIGQPDQFFRVMNADGRTFYTRNGDLVLDREGFLATSSGARYLDDIGEPVSVRGATELKISNTGVIAGQAPDEEGKLQDRQFGTLAVYAIPDPHQLQPLGHGLYRDNGNQDVAPAADPALRQGFLEQSNVDSLRELINMILVQREFQATTRAMTSLGRLKESFVSAMNR